MNEAVAYDVAVEEGGLNFEAAGPLFQRYLVNLTGRLDRRWAECYTRMSTASPSTSRFRLEPGASSISFTCRATDGPTEVMGVLKRLEDLLVKVNKAAAFEASSALAPTARPVARVSEAPSGGRSAEGPAAAAGGLFARFTRR